MGFLERLEEIGKGIGNIFAGPLGLPIDLVRATISDEYNPGFMGVLSAGVDRTTRGLSQFGEGTGLSALGRGIGEATPIDDWFKSFLDETELIYSTEFQRQQNQSPFFLRPFGVEPETFSLQRVGATATGAIGSVVPGGEPATRGLFNAWERSRESSPGRALWDNILGYYNRSPAEQQALRGNPFYIVATGTLDAVSRWYLQPEVIAGKGIKKARQHFNPDLQKYTQRAMKEARMRGYRVEEADELVRRNDGAFIVNLKRGQLKSAYVVRRRSEMGHVESPDIGPEEVAAGIDRRALEAAKKAMDEGRMDEVDRILGSKIDPNDPTLKIDIPRENDQGLYLFGEKELTEAERYARRLWELNPNDPPVLIKVNVDGLPVMFDDFSQPAIQNGSFFTMADRIHADNIEEIRGFGPADFDRVHVPQAEVTENAKQVARLIGDDPTIRAMANKTRSEIREEYIAHPTQKGLNFPRTGQPRGEPDSIRITDRTDGLYGEAEVDIFAPDGIRSASFSIYWDRDGPRSVVLSTYGEPSPKWLTEKVHDAFDTLIVNHNINVSGDALLRFFQRESLTQAASGIFTSWVKRRVAIANKAAAHWNPETRLNSRLYNPDGSPIEPGDIMRYGEVADDFLTASRLYSEGGPIYAEKFLKARARQRYNETNPGLNPHEAVLNSKTVQNALNRMDGMSADEIRRQFFQDNFAGQTLSHYLAKATTYEERRIILAAGMGLRMPEFDLLPDITRTRLDELLKMGEDLTRGVPPDEDMLRMIGYGDRANDLPPEQWEPLIARWMEETGEQHRFNTMLQTLRDTAPIERLNVPLPRKVGAVVRKTHWYQNSATSRPLRAVVENKPHGWVNVKDPQSDIQLVRVLEEARPLGIKAETVSRFRERYMAATTETEKIAIVIEAEEKIMERAAKMANLSKEEFEELLQTARTGRTQARNYLASRRYAPNNRDVIPIPDEESGEMVARVMPLLSTQLASYIPMADVRAIIKQSTRVRRIKAEIGEVPREFMEVFNQIWKPTVLLRGGWMIRVVTDEQLRILARTHSMLKHLASIEAGMAPKITEVFKPGLSFGQRLAEGYGTITLTRPVTAMSHHIASFVSRGARKLKLVDPDWYKYVEEAGLEPLVSSRASFGGPSENALQEMHALLGRDEATILNHLFDKATGQWRSFTPDDRLYGAAWLRALNEQLGKDGLAQNIMTSILSSPNPANVEGWYDDVVRNAKNFLRSTDDGRAIVDRMPWRADDLDTWIEDVIETLGYYTAEFNEEILRGALGSNVKTDLLESIDEALRPQTVHGEIIEQALGTSAVMGYVKDFVSTAFDVMGRLPTDTLSRQPLFRHLYANKMLKMERLAREAGEELTEASINKMAKGARAYAILETQKYLYNLAEVSRFGHMMRTVLPFYAAWQEVLKVWGGLAMADPSIIGRAVLLWKAPNRAGMVYTDDEGEEYIQFRMAERTADKLGLTGWSRYLATGGIRVGKSAFNLVLNNPLPGAGPLIQYPINEAVKRAPELEGSLKFLLPYGVSANSSEILKSPLVRQLASELQGTANDRTYQRSFVDAVTWMDNKYRLGERTVPPTLDEAHDIAGKLHVIRLLSRLWSPAQPIFDSPLKPYADIYRDLIENIGPEAADEVFLNEFGDEFFAVTLSRTTTATGIPPTVEAEMARKNYEDLLQTYPEYGRMIIGDDAAIGEFSSAAYAAQLSRPVNPQDPFSPMERTMRPVQLDPDTGRIEEIDVRLGWQEYIQAMDRIELERKRRGLPNLRVAAAEDLANVKRQVTQFVAQKYPAWWRSFNERNDLKWQQRIDAFRAISSGPAAEDRADLAGLVDYIRVRDQVLAELNRRRMMGGSATLQAMANLDLANAWETAVASILEQNIAFAPIYFRYLEGDPVVTR